MAACLCGVDGRAAPRPVPRSRPPTPARERRAGGREQPVHHAVRGRPIGERAGRPLCVPDRCSAETQRSASCFASQRERLRTLVLVDPLLASFVDLEGPDGQRQLRQAVLDRRFGQRTVRFNCFDVTIDADAQTVILEDAIQMDGERAVIPVDVLLRDLPA